MIELSLNKKKNKKFNPVDMDGPMTEAESLSLITSLQNQVLRIAGKQPSISAIMAISHNKHCIVTHTKEGEQLNNLKTKLCHKISSP